MEQSRIRIPCFKVNQWLEMWTPTEKGMGEYKKSTPKFFYLFKIKAKDLQKLSGVYRRGTSQRELGKPELGIERKLEKDRTKEIQQYIKHGFPLSTMKESAIQERLSLTHPGWLPSAIIVNIRTPNDDLEDKVDPNDIIKILQEDDLHYIELPKGYWEEWSKKSGDPINIIDGQHRLFSFEGLSPKGEFELPVVAFHGLDIGWQAYLFWVINIKPKRINSSLAYDLYPLLREMSWLDTSESHLVYREARAQEIVENLWGYIDNPWYHKINMLGETGKKYPISQSAMIKAIQGSYLSKTKGIFIAKLDNGNYLPWGRLEQAAFIALIWIEIYDYYSKNKKSFVYDLFDFDLSLLIRDQGVNGVLRVTNDLFRIYLSDFERNRLELDVDSDKESIGSVVEKFKFNLDALYLFIKKLANYLCYFEWRYGEIEGMSEEQLNIQRSYKGAGGYNLISKNLLKHLAECDDQHIFQLANKLIDKEG